MISQTGKRKQTRPAFAGFTPLEIQKRLLKITKSLTGFTLIELMIVAAVILVLVAVSTPLFRATFSDIELKDAAYSVGKLITYGQQRAIIEERKYRLVFDAEKRSYRLLAEQVEVEKASAEPEPAPSAEGTAAEEVSWVKATGRFGRYFYLPEGIEFKGDVDKITFLPNGRCDKISFYIVNAVNEIYKIETNGKAGYVKISEGEE